MNRGSKSYFRANITFYNIYTIRGFSLENIPMRKNNSEIVGVIDP